VDMKIRNMTRKNMFLASVFAVFMACASISFAQKPSPKLEPKPSANLLETLSRGMWQLRAIGGGETGAAIDKYCVGNPAKLAQIQHAALDCKQYVVRSTPNSITISYSCTNAGQGLTTIRKESSKLIHIDSQGIRNNSPFAFAAEARLTGPCGG
jgi:hypothetical protein